MLLLAICLAIDRNSRSRPFFRVHDDRFDADAVGKYRANVLFVKVIDGGSSKERSTFGSGGPSKPSRRDRRCLLIDIRSLLRGLALDS
jgi:hypothetical protein